MSCIIHHNMYDAWCAMHDIAIVHYASCSMHHTYCSRYYHASSNMHYTIYNVHYALGISCIMQCTCAVYSTHNASYIMHCTSYSLHYALRIPHINKYYALYIHTYYYSSYVVHYAYCCANTLWCIPVCATHDAHYTILCVLHDV